MKSLTRGTSDFIVMSQTLVDPLLFRLKYNLQSGIDNNVPIWWHHFVKKKSM